MAGLIFFFFSLLFPHSTIVFPGCCVDACGVVSYFWGKIACCQLCWRGAVFAAARREKNQNGIASYCWHWREQVEGRCNLGGSALDRCALYVAVAHPIVGAHLSNDAQRHARPEERLMTNCKPRPILLVYCPVKAIDNRE